MCAGIHHLQRPNPTASGDPLTFHLVQPAGQNVQLSSEISPHLICEHDSINTE